MWNLWGRCEGTAKDHCTGNMLHLWSKAHDQEIGKHPPLSSIQLFFQNGHETFGIGILSHAFQFRLRVNEPSMTTIMTIVMPPRSLPVALKAFAREISVILNDSFVKWSKSFCWASMASPMFYSALDPARFARLNGLQLMNMAMSLITRPVKTNP